MTEADRPVRVRIGPSPTGEPHVGTAYVALFNLAFARKHQGTFILRIEDTDQERSQPEWEEEIIRGLTWLGLSWDEGPDRGGPHGPYRQSERQPIYQAHAKELVERGHAYRCFCTRERLDALRKQQREARLDLGYDRHCRHLPADEIAARLDQGVPHTIRMQMPTDGQTVVQDRLRGEVVFENSGVDDQVLLKSDGFPTYHLANVVDDHLMGITHVIRAEEWITSTPKHWVLYGLFGWTPPEFIHLPLLRNKDKSKISKRKNPVSILDYKQRGFLPQAVLNYLAMLGFSMPDGRELFSFDEFKEAFSWERMSLGGPIFDLEKLSWLNGKYYREKLSDEALVELIRRDLFGQDYLKQIVPLVKERIEKTEDLLATADYFFRGDVHPDADKMKPKKRTFKELRIVFERYLEVMDRQLDFSAEALEAAARTFATQHEWKTKELFMPIRIAMTGQSASPPLFETMSVLGRALVRRRLRHAIEALKAAAKASHRAGPKKPSP